MLKKTRLLKLISIALLLIPYLLYVAFVIQANRGPVDYETFMSIGNRLVAGGEVYGENSYYPMPFVMVFALFSYLPRPLSMALWLLAPVAAALLITGGNPFALVFAPLFGHFVGGQTAVFGMLGLWGYRKYSGPGPGNGWGGFCLALTLLKPQLGIIPLAFAAIRWVRELHTLKRIPRQAWTWLITTALFYLPGFFLIPDWPIRWLSHPRPLFERALSGLVPRLLLSGVSPQSLVYWIILVIIAALLFLGVWFLNGKKMTLDLAVVWNFIVSPLVHDYDLIQLITLLDKPVYQLAAIVLSLPGWWVILFAYSNNQAWAAFSIIAPGVLGVMLYQRWRSLQGHSRRKEVPLMPG